MRSQIYTLCFYQIDKVTSKLPSLDNDKFIKQIKNLLFQKEKFEFNKDILDQLDNKKFNEVSFNELGDGEIETIQLNSIKDISKFENNSVEILYSMPINTFTMIADKEDNVFVAKVIRQEDITIEQNSNKFNTTSNEASAENRNSILKSYDFLLNSKYKVTVNEKTLDRVKNYFR